MKEKIAFEKGYRIDRDGNIIGLKGHKLKLTIDGGYYKFSFRYMGKNPNIKVHRFQAFMKYGEKIYESEIITRHLNDIKTDNSWDNILIGTHSDNMMDKSPELRKLCASHPKYCHKSIIKDHKEGLSYNKIMDKYGISSKGTVSFIINNSILLPNN
jgi:hypothetical protein